MSDLGSNLSTTMSNEALLAKWLENQLTPQERDEFERRCTQDADFSEQVNTANRVSFEAQQYAEQQPPVWNKQATFTPRPAPRSSPQRWQWMPISAMAMSVFAVFMVISGFQIRTHDGNLHMGFNLTPTSSDIAQMIDDRLKDNQSSNQALMAQYIEAIQTQDKQTNTELTRFLLETSREERREDFAELIKFINQQRDDDQQFYARQLNRLENEIYSDLYQE